MSEDVPLFAGYEPPEPDPIEVLSPDRRRTQRQASLIKAGKHPQGSKILHPAADRTRTASSGKRDPFTCGSCAFRMLGGGSWFPKCVHPTYGNTSHSAASDNRAWWPACSAYAAVGGQGVS